MRIVRFDIPCQSTLSSSSRFGRMDSESLHEMALVSRL